MDDFHFLIGTGLHFARQKGRGLGYLGFELFQYIPIMAEVHGLTSYLKVWYPREVQLLYGWFSFYGSHMLPLYSLNGIMPEDP